MGDQERYKTVSKEELKALVGAKV